jgi:osmotically-inducible protein OsmY
MNRPIFQDDEDLGARGPAREPDDGNHLGGGYGGGNFHDGGLQYDGARVFARRASSGRAANAFAGHAGPWCESNWTGRLPKKYTRSDSRIKDDVCERLYHRHDLDLTEVSVEVQDATVRLDGSVTYRAMKHRIEDVAAQCPHVKDVDNRIRVRRREDASPDRGT